VCLAVGGEAREKGRIIFAAKTSVAKKPQAAAFERKNSTHRIQRMYSYRRVMAGMALVLIAEVNEKYIDK
jgi:hypothetical protein